MNDDTEQQENEETNDGGNERFQWKEGDIVFLTGDDAETAVD